MPITRVKKTENTNIEKDNKKEHKFSIQDPIYSLKDIIVSEKVLHSINDVVCASKYKEKIFIEWGLGNIFKLNNKLGVNLYGPPGTGKTMIAHAIAKELNRKLICLNYSDIESKYVGETSKNLVQAFQDAKKNNAILFFDEADAMLSKRVSNMNNSTDVSVNQTRSVLLMLMNEYDDVILFATNFLSNYDEAFMRRIQFHINVELPDENLRKQLWKKYIPNEMPNNINIDEIARKYEGVSGSDIANSILLAAFKSVRVNSDKVLNEHVHEAIESILQSKKANINTLCNKTEITERVVSEEYVKSQLKGEK